MANKYSVSKMTLHEDQASLKATMQVVVNDNFVCKGIKVVDGEKGLFVAMPTYLDKDGKFHDQMFPVTKEDREALHKAVLDAYETKKLDPLVKDNTQTPVTPVTTRVYLNTRDDVNALGAANVTIGDGLAVRGVRIMQNEETKKTFLSYPSFKDEEGNYHELCHPITKEMHETLENTIMSEYESSLAFVNEKSQSLNNQQQQQQQQKQQKAMKATEAAITM